MHKKAAGSEEWWDSVNPGKIKSPKTNCVWIQAAGPSGGKQDGEEAIEPCRSPQRDLTGDCTAGLKRAYDKRVVKRSADY